MEHTIKMGLQLQTRWSHLRCVRDSPLDGDRAACLVELTEYRVHQRCLACQIRRRIRR